MIKLKLNPRYDLLLVAGLALIVRLLYIYQLSATPIFSSPIVDGEYHDAWAREILRQGPGHEGVFFRAPLYPYFLALVYSLLGESFLAARIVQAFLGAATASLTYLLGWTLIRRRSVALTAGLGSAFYGILVYHDGELLVETLFIPLLLAACLVWVQIRTQKRALSILAAGFLVGLAAICRPTALILLPIFAGDLLLSHYTAWKEALSPRRLLHVFALATGCLLPIFPVTWHNLEKAGDFVLIAYPDGINFYIGNNPAADGMHAMVPGLGAAWDVPGASAAAYKEAGRVLKPSEVNSYYSGKAWDFITGNPYLAMRLTLKKLSLFWNRFEISDNRDLYFFMRETRVMPILRLLGFWCVGPLALLGWWIGWHRSLLPRWFLLIIPLYMAGVVAFFVTARYRAPLIPILLVCAALALSELLSERRPFWDRSRIMQFSSLAVLGILVNVNFWGIHRENPAHSHFILGRAYMKLNRLAEAEAAYENALRADSLYPRTHLNLGVIHYMNHDTLAAESEYRRELEVNPKEARAWNNLGVLKFEAGDFHHASELYQKALELESYYDDARVNLAGSLFREALALAEKGQTEQAAPLFRRAVDLEGNQALYRYNYALALGRLGYTAAAQEQLEATLRLAPGMQVAKDLLDKLKIMTSTGNEASPQP
jgi:tetratricopeptide (TPR) repeat protein